MEEQEDIKTIPIIEDKGKKYTKEEILRPGRLEDEEYDDYKVRQFLMKKAIRKHLKGTPLRRKEPR
jgi:hypothetical protein